MKHYSTYQSQFIEMFGQVSEESPCLNDIARVYDGTHKTPTYTDSGIPFISVENITDIYSSQKYISREDYELYKHKPEHGDIFMTRIGSIGKCAVYESFDPLAYYVSLALIKPNKDMVHPKFLKYYIESSDGAFELRKRSLLKAFPMKINLGEIGKIKVIVPAKDMQLEFVKIAEQADKSKFTSLKSQFIEMFKNTSLVRLGDRVDTQSGGTPNTKKSEYYDEGSIPWLSSGEINQGYISSTEKYITEEGLANSAAKWVPKNSVVIAMYGATAGKVGFITIPLTTNQAVCALLPNKDFDPLYLYYAVASQREWMIAQCRGAAQPNISQGIIRSMEIPMPSINEQIQFADIIKQADKSKYIN